MKDPNFYIKGTSRGVIAALLGFVLCACLMSCKGSTEGAAPSFRPNILIISVESLRRDHVGSYDYSRPITPNIDKLAAGGTLFQRAYAQSSWTKPSIASTMTSTYVSYHQMKNIIPPGRKNALGPDALNREFPLLRGGFQTIASFFSAHGYKCYGWTANRHLWKNFGFGRGFIEYSARVEDEAALQKTIAVITKETEPWLIFLHIMAPHYPYTPPAAYRNYDAHPDGLPITGANWKEITDGKIQFGEEDLEHNIALYDGEIAYADRMAGRLAATLDSKGSRGRAIIVVMSDHGEEFLDHGGVGHGRHLHEELIRVPLVINGPGAPKGGVVREPVQNIDVFPTLARMCSLEPPENLQGLDVTPLFGVHGAKWGRSGVFAEVEIDQRAVIANRFKYINKGADAGEEMYDIIEDPAERNNLAAVDFYRPVKMELAHEGKTRVAENKRLSLKMGALKTIKAPPKIVGPLKTLGYIQ